MVRLLTTLPATLAIFASLHVLGGNAQNCYYPNGDLATGDAACSSNGGACCPLNWECESSGLCYLDSADYYGRYTCTDQSWTDGSCPQICTHNNTATGNEAVLQCSDGSWCCDGDRSWNCCDHDDTDFFPLPQGSQVAFISTVTAPTSGGAATSDTPTPSSTPAPSSCKCIGQYTR